MDNQSKIAGVILAGGLARRMNNRDKGLAEFKGRPLVSYAVTALSGVADQVMINANRNLENYQQFGLPVISDPNDRFDGPLAGMLAAMNDTDAAILLVLPCDMPFVKAGHLQKLLDSLRAENADVAVASDGQRLHPVMLAVKTSLKASLAAYLASGQRKVGSWLEQQNRLTVDFSQQTEIFININTLAELETDRSEPG